ncbi:hypothetical protein CAF53_25705 (plasmid) [Sphingobium sp. LB126]|nr:hypothetical protein CAF53_25705 [Sphingobium sp. LB126]
MADRGSCLFIQSDTLFVVEADMIHRRATPAHANIDEPLARIMLVNMDVGNRAPQGPHRGQFAFQDKL